MKTLNKNHNNLGKGAPLPYLHLITALVLFCSSSVALRAQSVVNFYLTQFSGTTNDTTITIKAQNNPIIYNGNFYWWPQNGTNFTTTNGFAAMTLVPSKYIVSVAGVPQAWSITVTNSATPLNAINLTTSTVIYNGINSLSGPVVSNDGHGNYTVTGSDGSVTNADGTIITVSSNGVTRISANPAAIVTPATVNAAVPGIVTNLPPSNGVNDSAMIQAALNSGPSVVVYPQPNSTYLLTNIYATNSDLIRGDNVIFKELPMGSNAMFDCGASNGPISFDGITFVGNAISNYENVAVLALPLNYPELYPGFGACSAGSGVGIRWNSGGGGYIRNCTFVGWNDVGLLDYNYWGTGAYQNGTNAQVSGCTAMNCYIGFYANGGNWNGYPNITAHDPASFAGNSGEYVRLANFYAENCGIGMELPAGNSDVLGATLNNNAIGFATGGGPNSQHGQWTGIKANHNTWIGCITAGGTPINGLTAFANQHGIMISTGGSIDLGGVVEWSTVDNVLIDLTNAPSIGTAFSSVKITGARINGTWTNLVSVQTTNCSASLFGNFDASGNSDGTLSQGLLVVTNATGTGNGTGTYQGFAGNGGGLTNLNIINDSTITSVSVVATNSNPPGYPTTVFQVPFDPGMTNFTVYGTPLPFGYDGSAWYAPTIQSGYQGTGMSGEAFNTPGIAFTVDGNQFIFGMKGNGNPFAICANFTNGGFNLSFVQTNPIPNDGNIYLYQVNFATPARRTIYIQTNNRLGYGVYIPATNGLTPNIGIKRHVMTLTTDSFGEEAYVYAAQVLGITSQLQRMRPDLNIICGGEGGTGWYNIGSQYGTNFYGRLADITNQAPEMSAFLGGINDQSYCTNTSLTNPVYMNATNLFFRLKANCPNDSLIVFGPQAPFSVNPGGEPGWFNCAFLLSNACQVAGVTYINPLLQPWINGDIAVPTAGNALQYTEISDNTHPTPPAGTLYYATQINSFLTTNSLPLYPTDSRAVHLGNTNNTFTGMFTSTNGAGASITLPIQTNSTGPHGVYLEFTNGLYIGNMPY